MDELLYHYCSLDTFLKIVQNKTIRASDISKTNDYSETKWIVQNIHETIITKIKSNLTLCERLKIDDTKLLKISNMANQVVDGVYNKNSRYMFTFVCCFSEAADLLSQWRGYADNGNGVAIGFDKKTLESFHSGGWNYFFNKVLYCEDNENNYINNCIDDCINAYSIADEYDLSETTFYEFVWDLMLRVGTLRNNAPLFKCMGFSEEREWRIAIDSYLSNYNNLPDSSYSNDCIGTVDEEFDKPAELNNGFVRTPTSFMAKDNMLIPYFDLNFEKLKNSFIKQIVLGPKCQNTEIDIQLLLRSCGFDDTKIEIKKSRCTYR